MGIEKKLEFLGKAAQYDLCGEACSPMVHRLKDDLGRWLYPAVLPDGRRVVLLKVLLTNACVNNCLYCANRAGRDCPRMSFTPEELASTFDALWRKGLVKGLFLSSAVDGKPDEVMARMVATAEIIRRRYSFPGLWPWSLIPAGLAILGGALERRKGLLLLGLILAPTLGLFAVCLKKPVFTDRYLIFLAPLFYILLILRCKVLANQEQILRACFACQPHPNRH